MKIKQNTKYICRINIRPEYNGRKAKAELFTLQGMVFEMEYAWFQEENDPYPGEIAMRLTLPYLMECRNHLLLGWFSSGDLDIISVV